MNSYVYKKSHTPRPILLLSHHDNLLEFFSQKDYFNIEDIEDNVIISSQNLKAFFLKFYSNKCSAIPLFAAFPPIADLFKIEFMNFKFSSYEINEIFCNAAKYNNIEIAKFLISHGVDINFILSVIKHKLIQLSFF